MLVMGLRPRRYLVISPSDFFVANCILLTKTIPMWIVGSGIRTKELGTKKLYWASNGFLLGSMGTHVEITTMQLLEELKHTS